MLHTIRIYKPKRKKINEVFYKHKKLKKTYMLYSALQKEYYESKKNIKYITVYPDKLYKV